VEIGKRGGSHDEHRHAEAVGGHHPLQARLAGAEVVLDPRQRDVHHQHVQEDHEQAEPGGNEREALDAIHR
jgi:hypothetical protein